MRNNFDREACLPAYAAMYVLLLAFGAPGRAETTQANLVCVTSAQELQTALTSASDGHHFAATATFVQLTTGHYKTGAATQNGPFTYTNTGIGSVYVQGGYNADCSESSNDPTLSVIDGHGISQVLAMINTGGAVGFQNVTIENGKSNASGGGVSINFQVNPTAQSFVDFYRNIFRGNQTSAYGGAVYASSSNIVFDRNLLDDNSAALNFGAAALFSLGIVDVSFNTVTQNSAGAAMATGGVAIAADVLSAVRNNIFWNNENFGLDLITGSTLDLRYNDYGILTGETPHTNVGEISQSPKFVDPTNFDFHLGSGSPLLGYTPDLNAADLDLDSQQTPSKGKADLGAYESTIFTHGFDD